MRERNRNRPLRRGGQEICERERDNSVSVCVFERGREGVSVCARQRGCECVCVGERQTDTRTQRQIDGQLDRDDQQK